MERALRTDTGEIRYFWKISFTLILTIILIVISRLLLILMVQQIFILQGMNSDISFQNAQIFVSESSEGQAVASFLDLILMLMLVFLLVTRFEKREFHLSELGLNLQRNTLPFVGLGFAIGSALFLGPVLLRVLFGTLSFPIYPDLSLYPFLSTIAASVIFYILNSFWQEVVFRGYLQTRAVEQFDRYVGVIVVAVAFVLFHGLVQTLTPIGILTGLFLFLFIGLLYDKTRSLYLVGVIHAVLNFLPVLFDIAWQGLEIALIYGIAFVLLTLVIHTTEQEVPPDSSATTL